MSETFPGAIPEIPARDIGTCAKYYQERLGFAWDWGAEGLAQVSRGDCRIFLTDDGFAAGGSRRTPGIVWLNLDSRAAVDALHAAWATNGARIVAPPEAKPWHLYEFTTEDPDGNRLRVFYDFAFELPDRGGRAAGA